MDNTVKISKDFLTDIHSFLQDVHEEIGFLQLESQLQQEELLQWSHHFETFFVQNIEIDSHKQQDNNVTVDIDPVPNKATYFHTKA